jgi:Holliday junction resolvase RusA-like endonuclease
VSALTFTVRGIPAPQGSKRHVGRGIMVESSKKVGPWRDAVRSEAVAAMDATGVTKMDGPLILEVTFYFARPKGHYRTGRKAHLLRDDAPEVPTGAPDLSKLVRSTEDALTDAGAIADDSRIALLLAGKAYTSPTAMGWPGARITVRRTDMAELLDLDAIKERWLNVCGACDAGIGECSHPDADYRPVMLELVRELEGLRAELDAALTAMERAVEDRDRMERVAAMKTAAELERNHLRRLAAEMLSHFTVKGHPGEASVRTGWVRESTVLRWHQTCREAS